MTLYSFNCKYAIILTTLTKFFDQLHPVYTKLLRNPSETSGLHIYEIEIIGLHITEALRFNDVPVSGFLLFPRIFVFFKVIWSIISLSN